MKNKTRLFLIIGALIFIITLFLMQTSIFEELDYLGTFIHNFLTYPTLKKFLLIITNIISIIGILIILVITSLLLWKNKIKIYMSIYSGLILVSLIVVNVIKIIIKRGRPSEPLFLETGYSFPSAHATISMVVYGYLIILINKNYSGKYKKILILSCIIMILLTGFSRIYFNVHYITDVLAGFGLGLFLLCCSNLILKKLTK